MSGRIIVTDCETLAALACVRDLGRSGFDVFAAGSEPSPPAKQSKYIRQYVQLPSSWRQPREALCEISRYSKTVSADALLPVSEALIASTLRWPDSIPQSIKLIRVNSKVLPFSLSKLLSFQRAMAIGLPVADGRIVSCNGPFPQIVHTGFPLIVRTDNRWLDDQSYLKGQHWIVRNEEELRDLHEELKELGFDYLIQRYFSGHGKGAFIMMNQGRTQFWHTHERIAEIPWTGGVSARRKLTFNAELATRAEKFLQGLSLTGPAMLEFREISSHLNSPIKDEHQSGRQIIFVELNARPWGSLALAGHGGLPFISQWALSLGLLPEKIKVHRRLFQPMQLQDQILCTSIYPGEVQHSVSVIRSLRQGQLSFHSAAKMLLQSFTAPFNSQMRFDFFHPDDIRPCIRQWQIFTQSIISSAFRRFSFIMESIQLQLFLLFRKAQKNRSLQGAPCRPQRILVVCYGNQCRSPLTEGLLRKLLPPDVQVISRGFNVTATNVPRRFHRIFRAYGVNPDEHTARRLEKIDLDNSDIVILMERRHIAWMLAAFGHCYIGKCRLLTEFSQDSQCPDIHDPLPMRPSAARHEFSRIASLCQSLSVRINQ